jgi:glycosyltransferase involved in cell wall biosynthesis
MTQNSLKLSVIIPTYNEGETVEEILRRVDEVVYPMAHEVVLVDDASSDGTYERQASLQEKAGGTQVRLYRNLINRGKGRSIRRGIQRATGDLIIIQDADTEYDPREIPRLLEPLLKGEAEVVYGSRFLKVPYPPGMAFPNWIANRFLTLLTNLLFGLRLTDMETCYKAFRAPLVKSLDLKANRFEFEPEITAILAKKRVPIKELPISYRGRTRGEGKKIRARDFFIAVMTLLRHRVSP